MVLFDYSIDEKFYGRFPNVGYRKIKLREITAKMAIIDPLEYHLIHFRE